MRARPRAERAALAGLIAVVGLVAGPARAVPPTMAGCNLVPVADATQVRVTTPLGSMLLELYSNVAPKTVANFLEYIQSGAYDGTVVHRVVPATDTSPAFVIQMGGFRAGSTPFEAIETRDPVMNEPCLSNVRGTIAMAKLSNQPDSATSQWFVNLDDSNVFLDSQNGGFTVFGEVIQGMDVADAIVDLPDRPDLPILLPYWAVVRLAARDIFLSSPLVAPVVDPGPVGCFDVDQAGGILVQDPQSPTDFEPDPATDRSFLLASTACLGMGTGGSPSFACAEPGRQVMIVDPVNGNLIPDGQATFGFAGALLSCADLAASQAALAQRIQVIDVAGKLVHTDYTLVPEPGMPLLAATALACLAGLRRRADRRRKGHPRHRGR